MNTKRFLAAILAVVILSIGFLSCEDKEDDTNTNPTTIFDVIKETYGFYKKPTNLVLSILDKKCWNKGTDTDGLINYYYYFNSDSTKIYLINSIDNIVIQSNYREYESSDYSLAKLPEYLKIYPKTYKKWEENLSKYFSSNATYSGLIWADSINFTEHYTNRALYLSDFQAYESTLNESYSFFTYDNFKGTVSIKLDYTTHKSVISVSFTDITPIGQKD
ncbi:MAG: hypothetical protein WC679_06490 [Bacteroidales bacterium]|jgi:hypothetical protein